jgi:hypothetical protein
MTRRRRALIFSADFGRKLAWGKCLQAGLEKAIETYHFQPRYALANLGHPSLSYWS